MGSQAPDDPMEGRARVLLPASVLAAVAILAVTGMPSGAGALDSAARAAGLPSIGPHAGTPTDFEQFGFHLTVPDGWYVTVGADTVGLGIPGSASNIVINVDPGCVSATPEHAVSVLEAMLLAYASSPGYRLIDPAEGRVIDAHAAADAFFTLTLSEGAAYAVLAVILGTERSTVWTFSGLMHNTNDLALGPTINGTLASFVAFEAPLPRTLTDPEGRFRIDVPPGWTAAANVTMGQVRFDAFLSGGQNDVTFAVVSEPYAGGATYEEARDILNATVTALASQPGFELLEPIAPIEVDAHPAAQAVVTWQPSTYNVVQLIAILPSPEWNVSWGLIGTMFSWDAATARSCVDAAASSFDVLTEQDPSGPGGPPVGWFAANGAALLAAGLVATAVEGAVLAARIVRSRRRT